MGFLSWWQVVNFVEQRVKELTLNELIAWLEGDTKITGDNRDSYEFYDGPQIEAQRAINRRMEKEIKEK